MQKLLGFYERVLESSGVTTADGYIRILDSNTNVTHNGLPLVLPTKEHIKTMLTVSEDGKPRKVKQLYNPLDETIIRGDSPSMIMTRKLVTLNLGYNSFVLGSLLLKIAADAGHQTNTSMLINSFLGSLSNIKIPNVGKVVDGKTMAAWIKLHDKVGNSGSNSLVTIYAKKGGKINGRKHNRTATLKISLYEDLKNIGTDTTLHGIKLRKKDVAVFVMLYEFLYEGIDSKGTITVGSDDNESPGFIAIYMLYLPIAKKLEKIARTIDGVEPELEDELNIVTSIDESELQSLSRYKAALCVIPREGDTLRTVAKERAPTEPAAVQPETVADDSTSAIKRALYSGVSGVSNPANGMGGVNQQPVPPQMIQQPQTVDQPMRQQMVQQPMQQQPMQPQMVQQPMQPQMQQQPMQQQMVGQPMYQQPMQPQMPQQPMYQQPTQQPMQQQMVSGYQQQQPAVSIGAIASVDAYGN